MKTFITYGNDSFKNSVARICGQAMNSGFFDNVIGQSDRDLDAEFVAQFKDVLSMKKGGGYWIWKPYIISRQLQRMKQDDILVYCDSGCTINQKGRKRLDEYIDLLNDSKYGMLAFELAHAERSWTNKTTLTYFDMQDDETKQLMATVIMIRKCDHSVMLIEKWLDALYDDLDLFTDKYNETEQLAKDHRHDQSVFSLLRKKYGCTIIPDETWADDWSKVSESPFLATRIRG